MRCANCGRDFDVWLDRRVICLNCGFDGGRILVGPLQIKVSEISDDFDPLLCFVEFLVSDALREA